MKALLLISLFVICAVGMDPDVLLNLKKEIERIASAVPARATSFITDITAASRKGDGLTDRNGIENLARSWKLPESAVQRFKSAMFANSVAFQSFQVTIPAWVDGTTGYATMREVVGIARNENGKIRMAFVTSTVKGLLIGQYDVIAYKKCKKVLFVKKCKGHKKKLPRGFSAEEISIITRALRGTAYKTLKVEASKPLPSNMVALPLLYASETAPNNVPLNRWAPVDVDPSNFDFSEFPFVEVDSLGGADSELETSEFLKIDPNSNLTINQIFPPTPGEVDEKRSIHSTQDFGSAVSSVTGAFSSVVDAIQKLKSESSSSIVNQFMGPDNGFKNLVQHCQVQRLQGMLPEYLPAFSERLLQRFAIPNKRRTEFSDVLADIPFVEKNQVMDFDMVFNINSGGDCKFVSLLVETRADGKIDWLIADFQANFKLAPNVFVVRKAKSIAGVWSKSTDKFKIVPRGITDADLEFVFKWMELIAYKRFADLLGLASPNPQGL